MNWVLRKIDMFIGACLAAAASLGASQIEAFIVQYVQRLGGHLDEAVANLERIRTGVRYQTMSDVVRRELEQDAEMRVAQLQTAFDAITQSNTLLRPLSFFRNAEDAILAGTLRDFVPAIPLDTNAVVYMVTAVILSLIAYEILKLPLVFVAGQPRRRKFKRRGATS